MGLTSFYKSVSCLLLALAMPSLASNLDVSKELWQQTVESLKAELTQKVGSDALYFLKHVSWIDNDKVKLQETPLELKMLNHVMPRPKDSVLNSFSNARSQRKVQEFLSEHKAIFFAAEQDLKVPATAIAGILYIETAFDAPHVKYYPAMDTLISLAALKHEAFRQVVLPQLIAQAQKYVLSEKWQNPAAWEERAKSIGEQWFLELYEFLNLAVQFHWGRHETQKIKSSWAGAIGFSQFLPSTARKQLKDHLLFDFWSWREAIFFTGRELAHHRFSKDERKALLKYNNAGWYADTVLKIHQLARDHWDNLKQELLQAAAKPTKP